MRMIGPHTSCSLRPTALTFCLVHKSSIRPDLEHEHLRPGFRIHVISLEGLDRIPRAYPFLDEDTVTVAGSRYCCDLRRIHQLDSAK